MKITFNPLSGQFDFTGGGTSLLNLKGQVATVGALPLIGNTIGDVYQVAADLTFRVWDGLSWDNLGTFQGPAGPAGPPGVQSAYAVGNWIVPINSLVAAGSALTANTIALYPFIPRRSITINNLGARVATAVAGSNLQLAIYGSDTANKVTGIALGSTASLSGATAASVSGPVTASTLQAGLIYWGGINSDAAPVMAAPAAASLYFNSILGVSLLSEVLFSATAALQLRTVAQTFGTWPDLTAVTPTVVTGTNASKGALIAMQVSALP